MNIKLLIKELLLVATLLTSPQNLGFASEDHFSKADSEALSSRSEKLTRTPLKSISITIDDLPFVGEYRNFHLNRIINIMTKEQVPATGFIIASEVRKNNWPVLQKFRDSGLALGNHTLTHANLNKMETKEYMHEIQGADQILLPVLTEPKYFRYPYLAMSSGQKKEDILCYLARKNYHVAPITIDSKDFVFNQRLLSVPEGDRRTYLEELKPFYLEFIWQQTLHAEQHNQFHHNTSQAQILLIHANLLNAYVLPDLIYLYKQKGYEFVSLEDALKTFKSPIKCTKPQLLAQTELKQQPSTDSDEHIEAFIDWD